MRKAVGCRPSPTFEKSVLQRAAGRKIGSEERTERPKLGFRHVVPEDGRICHVFKRSAYMPGGRWGKKKARCVEAFYLFRPCNLLSFRFRSRAVVDLLNGSGAAVLS